MSYYLLRCLLLFTLFLINSVPPTYPLMDAHIPCCSQYFSYKFDERWPYGIIEIPNQLFHNELRIRVNMVLETRLHRPNIGALHQIHTGERLLAEIMAGHPIVYRLDLPPHPQQLPTVTNIVFNGETVCRDKRKLPHQQHPSTMYLERYYMGQGLPIDAVTRHQFDNKNYYKFTGMHSHHDATTMKTTVPITSNYPTRMDNKSTASTSVKLHPTPHSSIEHHRRTSTAELLANSTYENSHQQCGRMEHEEMINPRILHGEPVKRGKFPWMAAIYQNKEATLVFMCGGSLVSHSVIVTAAHCAYGPRGSVAEHKAHELAVTLGRSNIHQWGEAGSVVADIKTIAAYPDWMVDGSSSMDADIAVIVLKQWLQFNSFVSPICLWSGGDDLNDIIGEFGTVAGWGMQANGLKYSTVLQSVELPIVSEVQCIRASEVFRQITSNRTICVGKNDGSGPCEGDSGVAFAMPINGRWTLRGIVSTAILKPMTSKCDLKQYVMLTDAAKFGQWIRTFL